MLFIHNVRNRILLLCCVGGIAATSLSSVALAVTARDVLYAAELATAGCRVTTLVANKLDAAGNTNARTAAVVAYVVQAANELLALINGRDNLPRALGYSGSWLVYDIYQLAQLRGGGLPVAIRGKAVDANGVATTDSGIAELVTEPLLSDEFFDSLQRDLLPAIETVFAVAAACVGWRGTIEQQVWRNRLQSMLSLSRIMRVCLERRHEPGMKYYVAIVVAHLLLTIAEFTPLLSASVDNQGVDPAVRQLIQVAQRRHERAQALVDRAERYIREQPDNPSARFNLTEAQDLFRSNESELAVVRTMAPGTIENFAEEVAARTRHGALLETRLNREEVEAVERMRPPVVTGHLNQTATVQPLRQAAPAPAALAQPVEVQTQAYFRERNNRIEREAERNDRIEGEPASVAAESVHEHTSDEAVAQLMRQELTGRED